MYQVYNSQYSPKEALIGLLHKMSRPSRISQILRVVAASALAQLSSCVYHRHEINRFVVGKSGSVRSKITLDYTVLSFLVPAKYSTTWWRDLFFGCCMRSTPPWRGLNILNNVLNCHDTMPKLILVLFLSASHPFIIIMQLTHEELFCDDDEDCIWGTKKKNRYSTWLTLTVSLCTLCATISPEQIRVIITWIYKYF